MHQVTREIGVNAHRRQSADWLEGHLAKLDELNCFNAQLLDATFELASPSWCVSSRTWFRLYDVVEMVREALADTHRVHNFVSPRLSIEAPQSLLTACLFKLLRYAPRRRKVSFVVDGNVTMSDAGDNPSLRMIMPPKIHGFPSKKPTTC